MKCSFVECGERGRFEFNKFLQKFGFGGVKMRRSYRPRPECPAFGWF